MNIPKSWNDVTLDMFNRLSEIDRNDVAGYIDVIEILSGKSTDDMSIRELTQLMKSLDFMSEPIPETIIRDSYSINGNVYIVDKDLSSLSVSQFMDFTGYVKTNPKDFVSILSVFLIPEGKTYGEYDMSKVQDDIRDMSITDVQAIFNFFTLVFGNLSAVTLEYLKRKSRRMELPEDLKSLMKTILDGTASCPSSVRR